ncbi:hypothetical protein AM500_07805 [Bacillus sp. FJAT-18017]|uniref:hypothetical protein n=1 Tax=Bacillus sp. FJAT-18017 TaxID=1705566 RepID=UPI0006B02992|nr:hypothetical protein [Bacillus sp. FJAT-18017]ALC89680.1 hypothetical protein AM500_07805 [Bacillus sp. FJAT-18017]
MKKNRLLICLLLAVLMIYYAGPRLSLDFSSEAGAFTAAWSTAALLVISGNMAGLVRKSKKQDKGALQTSRKRIQARGKSL